MEIREVAACGISEREFVLEIEPEELPEVYRIFLYAASGTGHYEEELQEELVAQLCYIVGPQVEEELPKYADTGSIRWKEEDGMYSLIFHETNCQAVYGIIQAVHHPGEGLDKALNTRLAGELLDLAPNALENLPVINR